MRKSALEETVRFPVDGTLRAMPLSEAIMRFAMAHALKHQDQELMTLLVQWDLRLSPIAAQVDYDNRGYITADGPSWALTYIEAIVRKLGLGKLIYPNHPAQRVALNPELVSLALSRFGDQRLARDQQKLVVSFTLTPKKVDWPEWWEPDLRARKCRVPERFLAEDKAEWKLALNDRP